MTSVLNSLMSGGYFNDDDTDMATDLDIYVEEKEAEIEKLSNDELYKARFDAMMTDNTILMNICEAEIAKRNPPIKNTVPSSIYKEWFYGTVNAEQEEQEQDQLPF